MRRVVIVDTSVVKAAGETNHPTSSACRECLKAILTICHRVAKTDFINEEWKRHLSRYSRKWMRSMVARRKLPTVTPNPLSLRWNAYSDAAREAIEKDRGLIEAALVADCIIITLDDRLQDALKERPDGQDLLRKIQWINPRTNGVAAIEML